MSKEKVTDKSTETPVWNLNDLFAGPEDPVIDADLGRSERESREFQKTYSGKLEGLSGAELGTAVLEYEAILERAFKVISYAQLLHAADTIDQGIAKFHQSCQERINDITGALLFFVLEMNRFDDATLEGKLKDPVLKRYRPWIEAERQMRPYQLADALEQLLHDKSVTGHAAWSRLFDETMAELRFSFDDKQLTLGEVLNRLSDSAPGSGHAPGRACRQV
ncbi:MAG: hypothetical protein WD075_10260 [Rhodospirillales bacterium]